jgi:hypothetical protein
MLRFILLSSVVVSSEKLIKNINLPACKNCIHLISASHSSDYASSFSKCSKFGKKNIISDEIEYEYVDWSRKDEMKCGEEGKFFEKDDLVEFKKLKHKLFYNSPVLILSIWFVISCIVNVITKVPS